MENIDWDKAPEGATHCEQKTANGIDGWMRLDGGKWFFWPIYTRNDSDIRWHECRSNMSVRSKYMVPRPSPAWSGEGIPPVGVVCEVLNSELSNAAWEKCTILFTGKHRVLYDSESCYERAGYVDQLQFRPIRTPEQIAADEREVAVAEMQRVMAERDQFLFSACEALYDAGYRKP